MFWSHPNNLTSRHQLKMCESWLNVLPDKVAFAQSGWHRARAMKRMHDAGMTYAQIGAEVGVTMCRVRQIVVKLERHLAAGWLSPVESYLNEVKDLVEIAKHDRRVAVGYAGPRKR